MDVQKVLNQASEHGIAAISAAIEALRQQGQQAEREADAAYQAYFSDAEEREGKVKRRLAYRKPGVSVPAGQPTGARGQL